MKERIEEKINQHIEGILAKEGITYEDYCILSCFLQKIEIEEKAKLEEEKAKENALKRSEYFRDMMKTLEMD
jgi:hypothetical protein